MILHGFSRSSAAWRVRIALNLKGLAYENAFHHLRRNEQNDPDYLKLNPQGLVPALVLDDGTVLTQSLAIAEYLDALHPAPRLVPTEPIRAAKVRAAAMAMAIDIHPLQNLRTLQKLDGLGVARSADWARDFNALGLAAVETLVRDQPGPFCFGDEPTLADICLVPQMFGARRFKADVSGFERLLEAEAACSALSAFADAAPERQQDAD